MSSSKEKCTYFCVICQAYIEDGGVKLRCRHPFHATCIGGWRREQNTCPLCRTKIDDELQESTATVESAWGDPQEPVGGAPDLDQPDAGRRYAALWLTLIIVAVLSWEGDQDFGGEQETLEDPAYQPDARRRIDWLTWVGMVTVVFLAGCVAIFFF